MNNILYFGPYFEIDELIFLRMPFVYFFSDALAIEGVQPEQGRKRATKQRTPKKIQQNPVNDA